MTDRDRASKDATGLPSPALASRLDGGRSDHDPVLGPVITAVVPSHARTEPGIDAQAWLLGPGRLIQDRRRFFDELCWRLLAEGLPLWRASLHLHVLHPQLRGMGFRWWRDRAVVEEIVAKHGIEATTVFRDSPLHPVISRGEVVRHRLTGPPREPDLPLIRELRHQGATDYLALPLTFSSGRRQAITFASDRPGGFAEADITRLLGLAPLLALAFEVHAVRLTAATLLDTYLGRQVGKRVLDGTVRRGGGEHIEAVILVADLRDFSILSDRLPSEQVLTLLNDVFDRLVAPIHAHGGEVLKFLGDGLLAIFSVAACGGESESAACALDVATSAMAGLDRLNAERVGTGRERVGLGIALHLGTVFFGNIGAADRLDFTAIGPAVNLAFRLEALTKRLGVPILASDEFAKALPHRLVARGRQRLDSSGVLHEVFTLPPAPMP